jgi:hypothetical protein
MFGNAGTLTTEGKRIRPRNYVFKGAIIRHNTRSAARGHEHLSMRLIVSQDHVLHRLDELRAGQWRDVPDTPGVYWWYFPPDYLANFQIDMHCGTGPLRLLRANEGRVCLYHGMATSLRQRVAWHSEQELTDSALRSGFLSTFRFTLTVRRLFHL